jgi:hypothetical protein
MMTRSFHLPLKIYNNNFIAETFLHGTLYLLEFSVDVSSPRGQPIPPSDAYPPFSRMSDYASPLGEGGVPFQRPFSTVRRYKSITLFHGIKVLLVSDKNDARVSSAAMTIRGTAGQFSDPPFWSGLAHLMEHITLSSIVQSQLQKGDFEEWLQSDYADGLRP